MTDTEAKLIKIEGFTVAGLSVRTINSDEFKPATAKLPKLWNKFFYEGIAEKIPNRLPGSPIYGVYSDYASDASDFYTVTAGVSVNAEVKNPELNLVEIQAGNYLVFKDKGTMPEVIINTWGRIWNFFEGNSKYMRRFGTDFEVYLNTDEIAIYIGIVN